MARGQRQFRSAFGAGSVDGVVAKSLEAGGVVVVVVLGGMVLLLLGAAVVDVLDDMLPVLVDGVFAGGLSVTGAIALGVLVSTGLVEGSLVVCA
jgi:hypothetical protein